MVPQAKELQCPVSSHGRLSAHTQQKGRVLILSFMSWSLAGGPTLHQDQSSVWQGICFENTNTLPGSLHAAPSGGAQRSCQVLYKLRSLLHKPPDGVSTRRAQPWVYGPELPSSLPQPVANSSNEPSPGFLAF